MKPLKIAFLWHMHQPDYELNGEYMLPWVRLHAIKDYYDFPALLLKYPNVKFNFNYVPSLFDQLTNLLDNSIIDRSLKLSRIKASDLTPLEKDEVRKSFFIANYDNMIFPYPRYFQLYRKWKENQDFDNSDYLDLQVWYNLCWFGSISKEDLLVQRLIKKGENFNEYEKELLLNKQIDIIKQIIPNLSQLVNLGQAEVSLSPYYHPILPLINNIKSAIQSLPDLDLSDINFTYPEDSFAQIDHSKKLNQKLFNKDLQGMWCSEGSLSNNVLDQLIENKIGWTASDEKLLGESLAHNDSLNKYFSWEYISEKGKIDLFFRDNFLSDKIGFEYSNWDPEHAVNDFFFYLHEARNNLINNYGEQILDRACVNIIMDGENCWEFYNNLGKEFREKLLTRLNDDEYFQTVLLKDQLNNDPKQLNNVKAGSWINANFNIWIGEQIHKKAWSLLAETRNTISKYQKHENYKNALKWIYKAESSDWFWWYYSEHKAPNKYDFDIMFRYNLKMALSELKIMIPENLEKSLWDEKEDLSNFSSQDSMHRSTH